jgi:hypothetical protein
VGIREITPRKRQTYRTDAKGNKREKLLLATARQRGRKEIGETKDFIT